MKVRYDLRCPHRNCMEPVIEMTTGMEKRGYVCKQHGPITPGTSTMTIREAANAEEVLEMWRHRATDCAED